MIIAFRGTEAFNLLNWCVSSWRRTFKVAAQCSTVGKATVQRLTVAPYILFAVTEGRRLTAARFPGHIFYTSHTCKHALTSLFPTPGPHRRTNLTINMTRHKRLGGVHDGFYSALFHRPAAGGSSLFEDLVGILREAAGDAEVRQMCLPLSTLRRLPAFWYRFLHCAQWLRHLMHAGQVQVDRLFLAVYAFAL